MNKQKAQTPDQAGTKSQIIKKILEALKDLDIQNAEVSYSGKTKTVHVKCGEFKTKIGEVTVHFQPLP